LNLDALAKTSSADRSFSFVALPRGGRRISKRRSALLDIPSILLPKADQFSLSKPAGQRLGNLDEACCIADRTLLLNPPDG
jgi:hypothetical protein